MPPPAPDNPHNPSPRRDAAARSAPRFVVDGDAAGVLSAAAGQAAGGVGPAGAVVELDADQSRHALRALRLSVGDPVRLLDGRGAAAHATIREATPGRVMCAVESVELIPPPTPRLTVASAVPKGPRGDAMVNDLAQLGADVFVPLRCARSVVHPGGGKLERYRKQSAEAAKQCGRAWFLEVAPLSGFDQVLAEQVEAGGTALKLLADPAGEATSAIAPRLAGAASVVVLVGPEGGFTPEEAAAAEGAGFVPWRFAPHVLRVETAAAAAVAVLRALA